MREVYTVTKVFGVDQVKTRVFNKEEDAIEDAVTSIHLICNLGDCEKIESEGEIRYIVKRSEDPEEYIEIIIRRCEIL